MNPDKTNLEELQRASHQWKEKIADLQKKTEKLEGSKKHATFELVEQLKKQQALMDQYLKHVEAQKSKSWDKKAAEMARMLKDINDTYRKTLPYTY
jgi:hypothetical protein